MLGMNVWYCISTIKGIIHPTFIMWAIFCIAVSLSFSTYWSSKEHNWLNNINNTFDLICVWLVTIVIIFFGKNIRFEINFVEIVCIALSFLILIFWRITKFHKTSNVFLQIVMVIAYLPTFYQLLNVSETTESLGAWFINLLASLTGIITAILGKDKLAIIYASRSFLMIAIMIILILRLTV
jgi:hypothetical protein